MSYNDIRSEAFRHMSRMGFSTTYTQASPIVWGLQQWLVARANGDQHQAQIFAEALLEQVRLEGVPADMYESIAAGLTYASFPQQDGGPNLEDKDATDAGVDWYEPDPSRFYALDKKSGVELSAVLEDLRFAERYIRRGARPPTRLLFVGPPGTGKTSGALWLGSQLGLPVALVRIDGIMSSLAGKTAKNVRAVFEEATSRAGILVIDEFEAIAVSRADSGPNTPQWSKEVTSALLQLLDSLPPTQIVIGATNVPQTVDTAVLRRMRKHIYFHPPDRDARATMVSRWWTTAPHVGAAKRKLLDLTEGFSGDVLERAAEDANRMAARRDVDAQITVQDVEKAFYSVTGIETAETITIVADQQDKDSVIIELPKIESQVDFSKNNLQSDS